MGVGDVVFSVFMGLLILGTVVAFGYSGFLLYKQNDFKVGSIVQTTFTGNPAFLTSALIGPKGEFSGSITHQDALNMMYCDVPGSAGAYSSWFRQAGGNSYLDPYAQASYSTHLNNSWSCTTDADCAALPWLQCGAESNCWQGGTTSDWSQQAGDACCGNAGGGLMNCSLTGSTTNTGICVANSTSNIAPDVPLYVCNTATSRCVTGSQSYNSSVTSCSTWGTSECTSVASSSCNTFTGLCMVDTSEHVMLNTPWLAEGTVSNINSDGTLDVQWTRLKNLHPYTGPTLDWFPKGASWSYQDCVFISVLDPTHSASNDLSERYNFAASYMALGSPSINKDPIGLPTMSQGFNIVPNVWAAIDPTLEYGWMGSMTDAQLLSFLKGDAVAGLPTAAQTEPTMSAWNLTAMSVDRKTLKCVSDFTIQNVSSTEWNELLLSSMTDYRNKYMGDRPPHLQIKS